MRIKLCIGVALLICLLLLVCSVDAQITHKSGVSSKPISEIKPIKINNTTGQAGTSNPSGSTAINLPPKQGGKAGQAGGKNQPITTGQTGAANQAGPTVINFDNLVTGGWGTGGPISVTNQYSAQGVTFNNARAIDYSKGIPVPGFAHSGNIAVEACYGAEFCSAPIEMKFNQLQSKVQVWVGIDTKSTNNQKYNVTLRAFDESGNQIGQDTKTLDAAQGIVPIQTSLQVPSNPRLIATRNDIARATVSFTSPSDSFDNGLAIDDVEFESSGILANVGPAKAAF